MRSLQKLIYSISFLYCASLSHVAITLSIEHPRSVLDTDDVVSPKFTEYNTSLRMATTAGEEIPVFAVAVTRLRPWPVPAARLPEQEAGSRVRVSQAFIVLPS